MSLAISVELDDSDLAHFVDAMQRAQSKAASLSVQQITDAAAKLLVDDASLGKVPAFIRERLGKLDTLIALVRDEGYGLPDEDRQRVLACLAYFAQPDDIIPDHIPVLGYLDDAIMIELCVRELRPELESYVDFVQYRNTEAARHGVDPATLQTQRVDWLEARRVELIERMRRRRFEGYGGTSAWKPALFRMH